MPVEYIWWVHCRPTQGTDIDSYRGMLWGTDIYVGQLTQLLKDKGMYVP